MAKKSLRIKAVEKPKFKVRTYNRCPICGRPRAFFKEIWNLSYLFSKSRLSRKASWCS